MKIQTEKVKPKCPHCEKVLDRIIEVDRGFFKKNSVFCCPECHKILGISGSH